MFEPSPLDQCSEKTRDVYERAKWTYDCAREEYLTAWQAVMREAYARGEMADHKHANEETDA